MFKNLSRDQKFVLWLLAFINFFNYIDRQVVFPLFHSIQQEFGVTDAQLGLLGTVFMLVHSLASVPLGLLADRGSRKALIASGVGFWSFATFMSGLAPNFKALLAIRSMVGIGEASYAPAATAMISDNFPAQMRARAQGFFNAGMFLGGTLGAMIGGIIAFHFNWRHAFFIVSIPGVLLAWLSTRLKDQVVHKGTEKISVYDLFRNPAYFWILVSGTLVTFAVGAYVSWGVEFVRRYKGYNLEQASIILGVTMMVAGIIGVFLGSYIADHLQTKFAYGRSLTIAVSLMLAAPLMFWGVAMRDSGIWFLVLFFLGTVLLSFYHGPATAAIHDIVPKDMRATAFAVYVLTIHLLGDTPAPAVVGKISDLTNGAFGHHSGLRFGLEAVTGLVFLAGLATLVVCYVIEKGKVKIYTDDQDLINV